MKRNELKAQVKTLLLESLKDRMEFTRGYKNGQQNYKDNNMIQDWENSGHPENYKKGYLQGVKDAKRGRVSAWITKFASALGNMMQGSTGNRTDTSMKWRT
jgi:hypothetical protein